MCEPTTLAAIAIGSTVVSTGMQAYGQYQAGQAQAAAASAQAEAERIQAARAEQAGGAEAGRVRQKATEVISTGRTTMLAGGFDPGSGDAGNLFASSRAAGELDAQTVRANAALDAWGHRYQAQVDEQQASVARRNSYLGPLATLAGGASQVATMGYTYKRGQR